MRKIAIDVPNELYQYVIRHIPEEDQEKFWYANYYRKAAINGVRLMKALAWGIVLAIGSAGFLGVVPTVFNFLLPAIVWAACLYKAGTWMREMDHRCELITRTNPTVWTGRLITASEMWERWNFNDPTRQITLDLPDE